jgi:hypothetical protein
MNDRFQAEAWDDCRFDRLVDGELSAEEYRATLSALDEEPGGWRRCALAFLEAQAWRSEMGAIRSGLPAAAAKIAPAQTRPRPVWMPLLAAVASFVVAFAGGIVVQRQWDRSAADASRPQGGAEVVQRPAIPDARGETLAQEPRSVGNIRLVMDGGQGDAPQEIDVPVYDQVNPEWLVHEAPVLPPEVIRALERRGRKVERSVEYLPLPLDEHRQIVLPVEQYEIMPVGRRAY